MEHESVRGHNHRYRRFAHPVDWNSDGGQGRILVFKTSMDYGKVVQSIRRFEALYRRSAAYAKGGNHGMKLWLEEEKKTCTASEDFKKKPGSWGSICR